MSISSGVFEIAPQIASFIHSPDASPIVLGYEWMVGATTVATLHLAKAFARVHDIRIHALVDEQDGGGPTVAVDFEHLNKMLPAALTRRDGKFIWREGDDAKVSFRAVDGTIMQGAGFSSIDVTGPPPPPTPRTSSSTSPAASARPGVRASRCRRKYSSNLKARITMASHCAPATPWFTDQAQRR